MTHFRFESPIAPKVKNELPFPNSKMCLLKFDCLTGQNGQLPHNPRPGSPRVHEYQIVHGSYGGLVAKTTAASPVQFWSALACHTSFVTIK